MTTIVKRNGNWSPSMFNDFFEGPWVEHSNTTAPAINVKESKHGFEVQVAAPGMTKDDFSIRIDEDNNLVIAMEHKNEISNEDKESRYLRREFSYAKFLQTLILPENVDKEKIDAKMEHGVLEISIPKLTEDELKKAQRTIEIR